MAGERFQVFSFAAVGSLQTSFDKMNGDITGIPTIFAKWSGNGSAKIHINNFPDLIAADWMDVTSWFVGGAQMTQANRLIRFVPGTPLYPFALRIEVDSLQAANTVKFAVNP